MQASALTYTNSCSAGQFETIYSFRGFVIPDNSSTSNELQMHL